MGTAPPPLSIQIGDVVLSRYRVVEQIAAGGHSVVFRGVDERLSRPVCIKVFSGVGGTKSGVGRTSYEHFVQEAFALSRLTHPNTLRIYDFGHLGGADAEGMPLQVCEYMNGGTLSNVIRERGTQSVAQTAAVVSAMCAALGEAHGLGIVHRDIKPQNILFGSVGGRRLPKLADFGIAKWTVDADSEDGGQRAEDTALVAGQKLAMYSPSWGAPEQLAGQPVSPGTDIYSLAVVAVYMLSGKAIFSDEDVYAGYKKRRKAEELVNDTLTPLGISSAVISILTQALVFDPKQRLARVEDLSTPLAAWLEGVVDDRSEPTPVGPLAVVTPVSTSTTAWQEPAPVPRPPWMGSSTVPGGPSRTIPLAELPQEAGQRTVHFLQVGLEVGSTNHVDLAGAQRSRVRITMIASPNGLVIHVKGLTCFVAIVGGRPSPAVQIDHPSDIALVTPRAEEIGHLRVATGIAESAQHVFALGNERVAVRSDDCADPILFDFGPGSDAYFVYTHGRPIPKSTRRG